MRTQVTYVVQSRCGDARWKDKAEYDDLDDAIDHRDDFDPVTELGEYRVAKRTTTKTDTVID